MSKQNISPAPNLQDSEIRNRLQFGSQNTNISSRPGSDQNNTASRRPKN